MSPLQKIFHATGALGERVRRGIVTNIRAHAALRYRIEYAAPCTFLFTAAGLIGNHADSTPAQKAWAAPVLAQFKRANEEAFTGLSDRHYNIARDLTTQAANYAMGVAAEHRERSCMWIALTTLFWLEQLLDVEPDLLIENGTLHCATYELLEKLKTDPELMGDMEDSCRKAAVRLGRAFNALELYRAGEGLFARRPMREAA